MQMKKMIAKFLCGLNCFAMYIAHKAIVDQMKAVIYILYKVTRGIRFPTM